MTRHVPLWAVASESRVVVDPRTLGPEVMHYSIPSLDATGTAERESTEDIKSAKLLLRGDEILISKLNPRKSRVALAEPYTIPTVSSTEFVGVRPFAVDRRYAAYYLQSEHVRQLLDAMVQSVTRSHQRVSPEEIMRVIIRVPPSEEQRRIADFLDAETARLDRLVAARQRQLEVLSERTLATITEAFHSLEEAAGIRLGYLARIQSGLTVDGGREITGDVVTRPYLRVANVQSGYLDLESVTEITVPRSLAAGATLRPGDVLMTEGGDLDKLGRGTVWNGQLQGCLHQNHVFAVRPDPTKLLPDYLALYTRSVPARMHFERTGTKTTNLASTSSSKIKDLRVPVVSLDAQRRLCEHVAIELTTAEKLTSAISTQVELIAERKQALVTAAVTGQFDVTTARGVDLA